METTAAVPASRTQQIPIDKIIPSPYQARKNFDDQSIKALAESLKAHGQMIAINVRPAGDQFELIAGERRWRAAQLLGWQSLEAKVESVNDKEAAERVLIENVQREDLSAIEQALAYRCLSEPPFNLNQSQIARQISKDQSLVNKYFAVSKLCASLEGMNPFIPLSLRHLLELCRLANAHDQANLADQANKRNLTVDQLRVLVDQKLERLKPGKQNSRRDALADVPVPADPLADIWEPLQMQAMGMGQATWGVTYGSQQIPGMKGVSLPAWRFWVANNGAAPRSDLKRWFQQMADAMGDTEDEEAQMRKQGITRSPSWPAAMFEGAIPTPDEVRELLKKGNPQ